MILEGMLNGRLYLSEPVTVDSLRYTQAANARCEENENYFKYGFSAGMVVCREVYELVMKE